MQISRHISPLRTLAQIVFVALPTIAIIYFLLWNITDYFTILKNTHLRNTVYVGAGILCSMFFYALRFRFITTTPLLFFGLYFLYASIDKWGANWGEFDAFFYSIQMNIFCLLFAAGWVAGWAFQRVKYFHFVISAILLFACIYVIARTGGFDYFQFTKLFIPVILYSAYIIFTVESLKNVDETNTAFWKQFTLRLIGFLSVLLLFIGIIILSLRKEIEAKIAETHGKGKEGSNATTQVDKDGNTQMNDAMNMLGKNSKNHELLFCAHIDNFFEGTNIANPLYLTSYHYTKFDTLTETFERDSLMPNNDEFLPSPGTMPLFSIAKDSSKVVNAKSTKLRKMVEIEVFNKKLSKNTFVSPSTAYYIQAMSVDKNFQKEFKSAYRARSMVSKLNSAYFIYNVNEPTLATFQEQRFAVLRNAHSYASIDSDFLKYYTYFPAMNGKYARIKKLGDSLAKGKTTTIDKVLAVRDYFLQRNVLGEQIYKYSDNPGIPGMPSASKLNYFLFETKKGYCAYYSGATLFLLRSMGIPCRITVGFLTEDRASKNKGWYWFYANQSHAWVEVYFPEYGWIDFDTTVGNDDSRSATAPDGTPPNPPAKAPLALNGKAILIDTIKKTVKLRLEYITFKDKVYPAAAKEIEIAASNANVIKDTTYLRLANLQKGEDVVCVSYDNRLYNYSGSNYESIIEPMKKPLPIDDIFINDMSEEKKKRHKPEIPTEPFSAWQVLLSVALVLLFILFLLFSIPSIVKAYLFSKTKTNNASHKLNAVYNYTNFYLHQLGLHRGEKTPYQFAQQMDEKYKLQYTNFINSYLKIKYSDAIPSNTDMIAADKLITQLNTSFQYQFPKKERIKKMLQPVTTINYLIQQAIWNKK
jgi:transglutaminase-like putative cysteine protease